ALLTRGYDWSATPLGAITEWPAILRGSVELVLDSGCPMLLAWGPEYVQLYNDDYVPILGGKHPMALGQPARECWSENWDVLGPLFDRVRSTGAPVRQEDQPVSVRREGYLEERYFTFSYGAVADRDGGEGGVLATALETTGKVLAERRLRTLRDAAYASATAASVDAAFGLAARIVAENPFDVPFALVYLLDGGVARLTGCSGLEAGAPGAPATVGVDPPDGAGWPFHESEGRELLVEDLEERFPPVHAGPWPEPVRRALVVPAPSVPSGSGAPSGFLVVGVSPRRELDQDYRSFLELLAAQVAGAVGVACAHESARRRSESAVSVRGVTPDGRFHALIEKSWDAIATVDEQGILLYASPSTIRVLGYA
ncbi:MAG: GAF domain-containing protein, partial [Candidatus Binatia bacterium]